MGYLDDYRKRLSATGNTVSEAIKNSTVNIVQRTFEDSPLFKMVIINGINYGTRILEGDKPQKKMLLFKPFTTIENGSIVLLNSQNWLVTDFYADEIYPKAEIELCNNVLHVQTGAVQTVNGYDAMSRPIINKVETYTDFPCVVKSLQSLFNDNQTPISVVDGNIVIMLAYTDAIKEGVKFTMFNKHFKITNIDYAQVSNNKGIMTVNANREV